MLVTGGAGFIGSSLVRALLERGDNVLVLDNFATGRRSNLVGLAGDLQLVEGDLRSYERVHTAVRGVDLVFHQGALGSVPGPCKTLSTTTAVNVEGTLNILLASRDEGVGRVIIASSSSVYGDGGTFPAGRGPGYQPDFSLCRRQARCPERFSVSFYRVYGLETVALRYFNVFFGPRQDPHSQYAAVVPLFARAIADGRLITIYGDGEQSRDFTYVANVVGANLLAAEAPDAPGSVLNIATGGSETVKALADSIGEAPSAPRSNAGTNHRGRVM